MNKFFNTNETASVDNYPYGRLKCIAKFGIEFKTGKGFRTTFQTINPKTQRINKVKNSTYSPALLMYSNEIGHIKYMHLDFYGNDGINKNCLFMYENFNFFTPEQIKHIYEHVFFKIKAEAIAMVRYCGADFTKLKPILQQATDNAIIGLKTGTNVFNLITIDDKAINECKQPNFNPFVTSQPISLLSFNNQ